MNDEKVTNPQSKYIPPQRRRQIAAASKTEKNTSSKSSANQIKELIQLTPHATLRQEQRNISSESVINTLNKGERLPSREAVTHIDEHTQVVLGRDGKVITIQENKRNTKYDLLNISNERVKILLEKIELKNNDFAMCELAEIYLSGDLGNREVQKAYDLLLQAATKKNSHAMCLIARLYESGDLGVVDLKKAQEWLEKAAKRNNRYALAILGQRLLQAYLQLNNIEKEAENNKKLLQKAMVYLKRSAAKGSTRAMWQLAQIYEEGWQGEKNLPQAIEQYSAAAKLGSPSSLEDLQRLVSEGKFAPEAFEAILERASKLIAKTSSDLAVQIGLAQIKGNLGTNRQRGFEMLEQAAKKNNKDAMVALGKCYRDGVGCATNPALAQYWFNQLKITYEKAITLGNINALLDLGNLFLKGTYGKIDFKIAEKLFMEAASKDDIDSIYYLGTLYIEGRLGDHDPSEGIPWINKAIAMWSEQALSNNADAVKKLIDLYLNKQLGFKNYQKAASWLSFLANKGNTLALSKLILLYLKRKVTSNSDEHEQIFSQKILELIKEKAVKEEHPKALLMLARLYQEGNLSKEQNIDSNNWVQKLETTLRKKAHTEVGAALLLGRLYKQEGGLLTKNLQQAAKWLCLAGSLTPHDKSFLAAITELKEILNNKTWNENERMQILAGILECAAQIEQKAPYRVGRILGDIYSKGNLVEPDYHEAAKWYGIAASLDNSKAMYRLGVMYQTGILGKVDLEEAIKLFESAAKQENPKAIAALVKLGKLDKNNLTTKKDDSSEVNSRKNPEIMYSLGKQYRAGDYGKTKDPVQAAFWFRKAAKRNHAEAAFELAQLYDSGQLGIKARPVAVSFFKLAAKSDHLGSINALINVYSKGDLAKADAEQVVKWQTREKKVLRK